MPDFPLVATTTALNGVPADELQRATLASLGMVFAQIATIDEVTEKIRASAPVSAAQ